MYRSKSIISLIQSSRNNLTQRFIVFNFSLKILMNYGKFISEGSYLPLSRISFKLLLLKKRQESFTVSSTSLTQPIIFSKIKLNNLKEFCPSNLVISKTVLMAMSLILASQSLRQRRMQLIIFFSYKKSILSSSWIAEMMLCMTSSPTIFFEMSVL